VTAGEELCIDYSPNYDCKSTQLKKIIKCRCGSQKCKGWLF
jgi:SET domain-containing protein